MKTGRNMPVDHPQLDWDEIKQADVVVTEDGRTIVIDERGGSWPRPLRVYRSHFSTCKQASTWRRDGRK
jgi:hypothetical protein